MKIKEIKSEKLYKEYNLQIPFEEIDKEIENKINDLIPSVTLPGFRKGKAPVNIVRKKYEDNVINDVIQKVINLKTSDLIKEKKLNIFRQPKIDLKKFEKNNPLDIEIKIDLQPDIKNFDFKKIKINVRVICPGFIDTEATRKNSFKMPFLKSADYAGKKIFDRLTKGKEFEIIFPYLIVYFFKFTRILPYKIYFFIWKKLGNF